MFKRKTLILMIMVSVLTIVLIFVIRNYNKKTTPPSLSKLQRNFVESIKIQQPGQLDIQINKEFGGWYLSKPVIMRADNSRIQMLLSILSLPSKQIYQTSEADLAELGLEPAKTLLQLNKLEFVFGNTEDNGNRRYIQHNDKFTLLPDIVLPVFTPGFAELADKNIVPVGITGLRFKSYNLSKTSGKWIDPLLKQNKAEALIGTWLNQPAKEIVQWPLSNNNLLTAPNELITITLGEDNQQNIDAYYLPALTLLHPQNANFAYTLTLQQAALLKLGGE